MMFKYCLLFALVAIVKSDIVLTPCPAGVLPAKNDLVFEKITVSGCAAAPCTFTKGVPIDLHGVLKVVGEFTTAKLPYTVIFPKVSDMSIFPAADFCTLAAGPGGKPCGSPVKMGDIIEYTTKREIPAIVAPIDHAQLRITIKDDAGHPRFCGEITVTIKSMLG